MRNIQSYSDDEYENRLPDTLQELIEGIEGQFLYGTITYPDEYLELRVGFIIYQHMCQAFGQQVIVEYQSLPIVVDMKDWAAVQVGPRPDGLTD